MPSRRIRRGALVGLGALLLVLIVWPFICVAAIPVPLMLPPQPSASANPHQHQRSPTSDPPSFLSVLLKATTTPTNSSITQPNTRAQPSPTHYQSTPNGYVNINNTLITQHHHQHISNTSSSHNTTLDTTRTHRIVRDLRIDSPVVKSENSHDEIEFKFKSVEPQPLPMVDPKLDRSQTTNHHHQFHRRTIEMPDIMMQSNANATLLTTTTSIDEQMHNVNEDDDDDLHGTTTMIPSSEQDESSLSTSTTALAVLHAASTTTHSAPHHRKSAPRSHRSVRQDVHLTQRKRKSHLDRNERSANMSHIKGTARKIRLMVKNRLIQILPDGTVNGTHDDMSEYSKCTFFFI